MDHPIALLSGLFSVFAFGFVVALLGSIKLRLAPKIGMDDAQFGKLVSVLQTTMVIMAILSGILLDNVGFQIVIILGMIVTAIAIFLIGAGATYGAVVVGCVILGIGGQFVNVGGNTLNPSLFADPSAGSNLGNTFFGLGAFLLPIISAKLLEKMDLKKTALILGIIVLVPIIFAIFGTFPEQEKSFHPALVGTLLANIVTWLAALTLFCYIGLEVSMATWITSYASELGADESGASKTLSIFFIFMMISRLVFGLQDKVTGADLTPVGGFVLCIAALLSAALIGWMIASKDLSTSRIAVGAAGFCFGPIFPTTIGVAFQHFDQSQWGTLFGIIFAIGLLGASTLPAWIGILAKGKSVQQGLRILMVTAVILAVISLILGLIPATEIAPIGGETPAGGDI